MTARGTALVRRPSPRLADGIVTHVERRPVDVELAWAQWEVYVGVLRHAGWTVVELEPADESPDSVFVEDVLVAHEATVVLTRPGAPQRRAELAGAERAVVELGREARRIDTPATLDGGDVLLAGDAVYVGTGARTNDDGARQLEAILGLRVVALPLANVLHLKTAAGVLPDGTVVAYVSHAPPALAEIAVAVPEPAGAQLVALDERRVLLAADCPRSAELVAARGFEPVVVDIGEFQKLEGCVTCLSVLLGPDASQPAV